MALLLTAVAAVAVAAVIGGLVATAFNPGAGAPPPPSGEETRLRIQPQRDRAACSGDKQAVDIFLDDLEARPSAGRGGVNSGLAGFQLTLLYDPSILRVESAADVQMNPSLASIQTAGGMRAFIPAPVTIDNLEGYVFFGAVGIPQGEPFDPQAAGPDPVATGGAILLFTVNFQTVGQGTSPLTVSRPGEGPQKPWAPKLEILEYGGQEYAPVVIKDNSLTVTAGKCAPALPVTPRPTQALPTPFPTRTPVVVPTPQVVTPVAAALGGRPDCPQGWNVYTDPDGHFSFCYPPDLQVRSTASTSREHRGSSVTVSDWLSKMQGLPPNGFYLAMRWDEHPAYSRFAVRRRGGSEDGPGLPLTPYLCSLSGLLMRQETSAPAELQIAGRTGLGCTATGFNDPSGPRMKADDLVVPVSPDWSPDAGYVNLKVRYVGPDLAVAEARARAILDTLLINER
jgi:hypothetical protein